MNLVSKHRDRSHLGYLALFSQFQRVYVTGDSGSDKKFVTNAGYGAFIVSEAVISLARNVGGKRFSAQPETAEAQLKIARYLEARPKGLVELKQLLSLKNKHFAEVSKKKVFSGRTRVSKTDACSQCI